MVVVYLNIRSQHKLEGLGKAKGKVNLDKLPPEWAQTVKGFSTMAKFLCKECVQIFQS